MAAESGGLGEVVLAIDVGTTNAKAGFYRRDASEALPPLTVRTPVRPDGTADPELLGEAVDSLLDQALAAAPGSPAAVGFTCAWHGLVGINGRGRPSTELTTWYDVRAAAEAVALSRRLDPSAVHERTGAPLHPSFPPARLLRLRERHPGAFARTSRWCSLGEFLLIRWFGPEIPASPSMASGSGLFDQSVGRWDQQLLETLGLDVGRLGPISTGPRPGGDVRLRPAYADRWRLLRGVPWTEAFGDGGAAVVGSACEVDGRAALTVGTSAAARVIVPVEPPGRAPLSPALFRYRLEEDRVVVGVARSNAGNLLGWARRVLRVPRDVEDEVLSVTRGRPPGAHGLEPDSSLAGERSPRWPPAARGVVGGLRIDTTPEDILQALLEHAVLGLAAGLDELEKWAGPQQFVLSGGAAWTEGWTRLLADGTGRSLRSSEVREASLLGAAALAWRMVDREWKGPPAAPERETQPDPERAAAFRRLRREWFG